MSFSKLPPWGVMAEGLLKEIDTSFIPRDWTSPDGAPPDRSRWSGWRDGIIERIAHVLWPVYDGGASWDTEAARALLRADFSLLAPLHRYMDQPIAAAFPTTVTHADFFVEEDSDSVLFGTGYERYDPLLPPELRQELKTSMNDGIVHKVATLDLQMKQKFLRPRAYQVAVIDGHREFRHREAKSANTPSMVSGHCLESSIAGCQAFKTLSPRMAAASIDVLRQFTVDIGDRRVFAGVHYPSDSLSSWLTAFHLIPRVFGAQDRMAVAGFLWEAIGAKSAVYRLVREHAQHTESPYVRAIDALEQAAQAAMRSD
jgi:hypothetical protein